MHGGVPLEMTTTPTGTREHLPHQLLDAGNHFDDISNNEHRNRTLQYVAQAQAANQQLPHDRLHDLIAEANLQCPVPIACH